VKEYQFVMNIAVSDTAFINKNDLYEWIKFRLNLNDEIKLNEVLYVGELKEGKII